MTSSKWLALALFGSLSLTACADGGGDSPDEASATVLAPGEKADNFRSESAQEYYVRGTATITLDGDVTALSEEQRVEKVRTLIPYKQVAIGYFLNTLLIDKSEDASNAKYGGFKALTKNGAYEDLEITRVDDRTYTFRFVQEVGGQLDLLRELARKAGGQEMADGSVRFQLAVGKLSNAELMRLEHEREWYRSAPWSNFSTESVPQEQWEYQEVEVLAQKRSDDAWIDYSRLFEDGVLDIGAFYGWDYHGDYHRKHAETAWQWLISRGFTSPVPTWEEYKTRRGPLTRTIKAQGREVRVNVTLWWGEPGTMTDADTDAGGQALEDAMRQSFLNDDVVIYSGHSGPWYGFALANWRKTSQGDLDDSEVPSMAMPFGKYQVVLAEGCDTYALGQSFWQNPAKSDRQHLDIITTTSFSNASSAAVVTHFLDAVTGADIRGNHVPQRYGQLLRKLDNSAGYWFKTMYGVHGIDDNPKGHPYGRADLLCQTCSVNADCGGTGNSCVNLQGGKVCTFECTGDAGCPEGYTCRETATGNTLGQRVCIPQSYQCQAPGLAEGPSIVIQEFLADPAEGRTGDANGDGRRHTSQDEFVELRNVSGRPMDISGWTLSDNVMVRFTFPRNTVLEPNAMAVVFGGGVVSSFRGIPSGVRVFSAPNGLSLNNSGDSVIVTNGENKVVDQVNYGSEAGRDRSLVRKSPDAATFEANTGAYTPGR